MATITITTGQGSATQTISTGARGPQGLPGSDASVDSYVGDIATLPDYPTSFPTAPADINNIGGHKLIGRHTGTTGAGQEIGIDGGLAFQGGTLKVDLATAASTWRTELGLGSLATLSSVSLTTNVTGTLPVANGGTGATTATAARDALLAAPSEKWVFEGDSWTAGTAQGNDRETWPYYILRSATARNRVTGINVATAGQSAQTMVGTFSTQVIPHLSATATAFIFAGINDASAGRTTTQLRDDLRTMWTAARNAGATVVAFTLPHRTAVGGWSQSDWKTINDQIIADSSYYDHLVPTHIICSNALASFYTDNLHINTASHSVLAARILDVLDRRQGLPIANPDLVCNTISTSTLSANTRRNLPFSEVYDANNDGTTATVGSDSNVARFVVPVDGTYEISANLLLGSLASGDSAYLTLWHTPISTGTEVEHRLHFNVSAGANMGLAGTKRIRCTRGDFLNVSIQSSKASTSILSNANFSTFQVRLVSIP